MAGEGDIGDPVADMTPSVESSYMAAIDFFGEQDSCGKNFLLIYATCTTFCEIPQQYT